MTVAIAAGSGRAARPPSASCAEPGARRDREEVDHGTQIELVALEHPEDCERTHRPPRPCPPSPRRSLRRGCRATRPRPRWSRDRWRAASWRRPKRGRGEGWASARAPPRRGARSDASDVTARTPPAAIGAQRASAPAPSAPSARARPSRRGTPAGGERRGARAGEDRLGPRVGDPLGRSQRPPGLEKQRRRDHRQADGDRHRRQNPEFGQHHRANDGARDSDTSSSAACASAKETTSAPNTAPASANKTLEASRATGARRLELSLGSS